MSLCLIGNHGVDQLEQWVKSKFTDIANKEVVLPDLCSPEPFPLEYRGRLIRQVPIKEKDSMTITFVLPSYELELKSKPLNYFSHLFGHEGENSLLSYLISEGLALDLNSYPSHKLRGFSTLSVHLSLTKKGLENYERVIEAFF